MSTDLSCGNARVELSARLDGEVDAATARALELHLEGCAECRRHEEAIAAARRALRTQPAGPVPDLSGAIAERVERIHSDRRRVRHGGWGERLRIAGIAAAAAALLVAGASLPFSERPPDLAAAADIARHVRSAARSLSSYRATFAIVERGWHRQVPVRRMRASVAFLAPEKFRLEVRDRTDYPRPGAWPRNTVTIVANALRWSIREPWSCPPAGLPRCPVGMETRGISRRQPFDGASALPTDIMVPLETLASSDDITVLGEERVLGRRALRLALPYRRAAPLVSALQAGGNWRTFEPFDRVHLWIDRATWFPLRFEVRRGDGPVLFGVRALAFEESLAGAKTFRPARGGIVKDGGFRSRDTVTGPAPHYTAGLDPYRRGVTSSGQRILSYADGMTWLKVTFDESTGPDLVTTAEEVALGESGYAYYQPAAGGSLGELARRRVDVFGQRVHVHLESNLARAQLVRVARSLGITGRRLQGTVRRGGFSVRRLRPVSASRIGFVKTPAYLPAGYSASSAFISRSRGRRTVTIYYRTAETEYDGFGIRITQGRPVTMLPPTSESLHSFTVGNRAIRWSEERGEAEWRDGTTYRAVAAPSFGWRVAARIIRSLR